MKRIFSMVLCLCLCASLLSCQKQRSTSKGGSSQIEESIKVETDAFIDLWDSHYNGNTLSSGNVWETDSFSLVITAKRGSRIDANVDGNENEPYIEVDFSLHEGTIEDQWTDNKMLFYIYSYANEEWTKIWGSDDYYWYFYLQGDDVVGRRENAETAIYDGTKRLAVLIAVNGSIYTAFYSVNI